MRKRRAFRGGRDPAVGNPGRDPDSPIDQGASLQDEVPALTVETPEPAPTTPPAGPPSETANAAQSLYWNTAAGQKWAAFQHVMDAHMEPLTDTLLRKAAPQPGEAVLDVGSGAGDTVLRVAGLVGPSGQVVGLDVSGPLLAAAHDRLTARKFTNVTLARADAQVTAWGEQRFDLILSRFGVMFFDDPVAAFGNLRAGAKRGGRLCFVCWGPLEENPWFSDPLAVAARELGPTDALPPRAPGPLAFSDRQYAEEVLVSAGWTEVRVEPVFSVMLGLPTAQEEAAFLCELGPVSRLIAERNASKASIRKIKTELAAALQRYATVEGVRIPALLYYVTARADT